MVVGMDGVLGSEFPAHQGNRTVGDDFVYVHMELSSRSGLPDYKREMIVQFPIRNFLCCRLNRFGYFLIKTVLTIN